MNSDRLNRRCAPGARFILWKGNSGRGVILILGIVLIGNGLVEAQVATPQDPGIRMGHLTFYPSLLLNYRYDDNVRFRSQDLFSDEEIVASGVAEVSPQFLFDLPFGANDVKLLYAPLLRGFSAEEFSDINEVSHFVNFQGRFALGRSVEFIVRDHYVQDYQELDLIDPGSELAFGFVPFTLHQPQVEIGVSLGPRQTVAILGGLNTVDFDERGEVRFFDYDQEYYQAQYSYKVSEPTTIFGLIRGAETDQQRDQILFGDIQVEDKLVATGLTRSFNETLSSSLIAGYKTMEFEGSPGDDFSGFVFDIDAVIRFSEVTRLVISLSRNPYQSFYVNNNYYVANEIGLQLTQSIGRRSYWEAGVKFQENIYADPLDFSVTSMSQPTEDCNGDGIIDGVDCDGDGLLDIFSPLLPSEGVRRRDERIMFEIGTGIQLNPRVRLYVGYNFESRESNIVQERDGVLGDPFNFVVNRVIVRFQTGWM